MKNAISNMPALFFALLVLMGVASCGSDDSFVRESDTGNVCTLIWDADIVGFDSGTRAVTRENRDGDCVYILFKVGDRSVNGTARYTAADDTWKVNYSGSLTLNIPSTCKVFFFEDIDDSQANSKTISLSPHTLVCRDLEAEYVKRENDIVMKAHLTPETGRITFQGYCWAGLHFLRHKMYCLL